MDFAASDASSGLGRYHAQPSHPICHFVMSDPFYQHHVFICTNVRDDGRACCAERGAQRAQEHAKRRVKALNMNGQGKVRINKVRLP